MNSVVKEIVDGFETSGSKTLVYVYQCFVCNDPDIDFEEFDALLDKVRQGEDLPEGVTVYERKFNLLVDSGDRSKYIHVYFDEDKEAVALFRATKKSDYYDIAWAALDACNTWARHHIDR
jgi:hypothetical protein